MPDPGPYDDVPYGASNPDYPDGAPAPDPWVTTSMGDMLELARSNLLPTVIPTQCRILDHPEKYGLFYRAKINNLTGESGSGKSWIALYAAYGEVLKGHHVIWVDYEDDDRTLALRMLALGWEGDLADQMHHVQAEGHSDAGVAILDHLFVQHDVSLIVFDSAGEALAADGVSPNQDDEVARWFSGLPRRYSRKGAGVITIDHLPKPAPGQKGKPAMFSIGSQRKRGALTGSMFVLEDVTPFSRHEDGRVRLWCAKDRGGWYPKGTLVAEAAFIHGDDGALKVQVWRASERLDDDHDHGVKRPTIVMQEISKYIEEHPSCSKNAIEKGVKGKATTIRWALELLVEEGNVLDETGKRGAIVFSSAKPFRIDHGPADPGIGGWDISELDNDSDD